MRLHFSVATVALCITLIAANRAHAQLCPQLIDSTTYGPTRALDVQGDIAVANSGQHLLVFDASDPDDLVFNGDVDLGAFPEAVVLSGETAVVLFTNGAGYGHEYPEIVFVDVSNPLAPVMVGTQTTGFAGSSMWDIVAHDGTVYVAAGYDGVSAYSLEPGPTLTLRATVGFGVQPRALSVDSGTGYVYATGFATSYILDFSDFSDVQSVGWIDFDSAVFSVFPERTVTLGTLAFVSTGETVQIWDVSSPATPVYRSTVYASSQVSHIGVIAPSTLLVLQEDHRLSMFDVSNPMSAQHEADYRFFVYGQEFVNLGEGRTALAAWDEGVVVLGVNPDYGWLAKLDQYVGGISSRALAMDGSTLFSVETTISIFSTSPSTGLTLLRSASVGGRPSDIAVDGDYAVTADPSGGTGGTVQLFNVSNPVYPLYLDAAEHLMGYGIDLDGLSGAACGSGVAKFFIDPVDQEIEPFYHWSETHGETNTVSFVPDTDLILTRAQNGSAGGDAFEIYGPPSAGSTLETIGTVASPSSNTCVDSVVVGNRAYFACYDEITLVDVTDPANPVATTVIEASEPGVFLTEVELADEFLIVGDRSGGIWIYDIVATPLNPQLVGSYSAPEGFRDLAADQGALFAAGFHYRGPSLFTVEHCEPIGPELFADGFESGDTQAWSGP